MNLDAIPFLIKDGWVKSERHPELPLTIYNYTAACQYARQWCGTSRACRGLIVADSGEIIARPFPKFHNLDEHSRSEIAFSKPFTVTEKMDGSLGILYPDVDGWSIATRGSFVSVQARRATRILRERYADFCPPSGTTWLFEILFPENRIVVDYGDREDLVLLAVIDNASGRDADYYFHLWPGPISRSYSVSCKPREVIPELGLRDDGNTEGVVLRFDWPKTGPQFRVKVKLAEYVRLHRILFGCSAKTVWESLSEGKSLDEIAERVPDEFHAWLRATIDGLNSQFLQKNADVRAEFAALTEQFGPNPDRKAFALEAVKSPNRAHLFRLLDGHSPHPLIWKELKPESSRPFRSQLEDVA